MHSSENIVSNYNFSSSAHIKTLKDYEDLWQEAKDNPEIFWHKQAKDLFWFKHWHTVFSRSNTSFSWFDGGSTNVCFNCVDRHLTHNSQHTALIWEGEDGETVKYTFLQLHHAVCTVANGLKSLGLKSGDCVTLYMPMIPELVLSMLACSRLGIMHNVVFAGFSAQSLKERVLNSNSKVIITADGGYRRKKVIPLKSIVDQALSALDTIKQVVVVKRANNTVNWCHKTNIWWHDFIAGMATSCNIEAVSSEHPLFLLYTSGSTGKPKGIMHTTGGYLVGTYLSCKYVFDQKADDIFWCSADIGWITGHSYVVYGPLANGMTTVIYEGSPDTPDWGRFWQVIEKHKVTKFYTAPTAIRACIKHGSDLPKKYDLSSLRLLGSVGESIHPDTWRWYYDVVGNKRCPIVDTWWQTETGSIMIAPLPAGVGLKPGAASKPFFGVQAAVVNKEGKECAVNEKGYLVIKNVYPSMGRTIFGDHQRYLEQYWQKIPGFYFTADAAMKDKDGDFWILGRMDDVINVSGHRLSTVELEAALVSHSEVVEAAVIGCDDEITGQALSCFVVLNKTHSLSCDELKQSITNHLVHAIGAFAKPAKVFVRESLPKTRSGKIMRRLLRYVAQGIEVKGDLSTLEDEMSLS